VAGDADAARMLSDLWQLARGRQPGANVPQDVAGVMAQQGERELADQRRVLDTWRGHMRLNDLGAFQLERGEAKESEIAEARREIARLKKDGEFTRKLTAGGAAEIDLWSRMHKVGFGMRAIPG
jgi:hypothetical protein